MRVNRLFCLGMVLALLAAGCRRDAPPMSELHDAALRGNRKMVELLPAHGADVEARDNWGRTPLDEAIRRRHKDVIELLTGKTKEDATNVRKEEAGS